MPPILNHAEANEALLTLSENLSRACNDAGIFLAIVEVADLPPPREIELDDGNVVMMWNGRTRHVVLAFGPGVTIDAVAALAWLREGLR